MAKRKTVRKASRKKSATKTSKKVAKNKRKSASRKRKTSEEMISELQAKIRDVKQREALRELKRSPSINKTVNILRGIDKALEAAAEEGNSTLRHALAGARRPLGDYLQSQGMKLPKVKLPRGRKPAVLNNHQ